MNDEKRKADLCQPWGTEGEYDTSPFNLKWDEAKLICKYLGSQFGEVQVESDYDHNEDHVVLNLVVHANKDELYYEMEMIVDLDSIPNYFKINDELDMNKIKDKLP